LQELREEVQVLRRGALEPRGPVKLDLLWERSKKVLGHQWVMWVQDQELESLALGKVRVSPEQEMDRVREQMEVPEHLPH
jgi:hypothetical protein